MKRGRLSSPPLHLPQDISGILYLIALCIRWQPFILKQCYHCLLCGTPHRLSPCCGTTLHSSRNLAVSLLRCRNIYLNEVPSLLRLGVTVRIHRLSAHGRYPLLCSTHRVYLCFNVGVSRLSSHRNSPVSGYPLG